MGGHTVKKSNQICVAGKKKSKIIAAKVWINEFGVWL